MTSMSKASALDAAHAHFPSFLRSRAEAILLDKWVRGEQYDLDPGDLSDDGLRYAGRPFRPNHADISDEYDDLAERSPNAFAGLVVTSLAQTAYVDGMRRPGSEKNMKAWDTWQANRWDAKQGPIHRAAIGMGSAFGVVIPGSDPLTGEKRAKMLARSPKRMSAFYDYDDDEWCMFALECDEVFERSDALGGAKIKTGWMVRVYDEKVTHFVSCKGDGLEKKDWSYIESREHGQPVPPVARLCNRVDLDGRATGEIEPVIPLLRRIDQDVFDRLIVQRFGAWKVRYIAGMAKPAGNVQAEALRLSLADFLVSPDKDTKFGTLDASDTKQYSELTDADLRMLSAITQTPPHHLLGLSSNLQAEALAAAESGLQRKSADFKMNAGEFHEQMARLTAMINGDKDEANAFDMQVRWRDTESRSLTQAADALGKMAVQLKIPVEMLWERLPGWSDMDTERAKSLVENGGIDQLLMELAGQFEDERAEKRNDASPEQANPSGK